MAGYVALQDREFALEAEGYTATRHQREVGAGYFDHVATVISGGKASTLAITGSHRGRAVLERLPVRLSPLGEGHCPFGRIGVLLLPAQQVPAVVDGLLVMHPGHAP